MTDAESDIDPEASISEKMDRVHEIIDTIEAGELSLERAKQLRDEGRAIIDSVGEDLDLGSGDVLEQE
ncbi:exodeoxyribonuclease VII small subunit [Halorubellus litoreus]|uniref:Exodeoxyribonuclease VII small subunit n=1 Tax=Halorubellus litoreus TaxID=755308 RepID=A0ABD5VLF8_9EURY